MLADGTTEIVADGLPSVTDNTLTNFGPTDVAFIGGTLYVLIELGGCTHALPNDLPAILRVNPDGSTTNVANLNAWLAKNPPFFVKVEPVDATDQEPGGVFHSMIAHGKYLYVVETNRGMLLRVDPRTGAIKRVYDMSIDSAEHNPIVMTRRGNDFLRRHLRRGRRAGGTREVRQGLHGLHAAVPVPQPDRRPGVARQPAVRRRDLPLRQSMDARQREPRHVRSTGRASAGRC